MLCITRQILLFLALSALVMPVFQAEAQDKKTWLDDQSVAVIRFNVKDSRTNTLVNKLIESLPPAANELKLWQEQLRAISQSIVAAGGEELMVVYSFADDFGDQPLWVVPKANGLDLRPMSKSFPSSGAFNPIRKAVRLGLLEIEGATVFGAAPVLERVKVNQSKASQELREFVSNPAGSVSALLTLNSDQRRALAEIQPAIPEILGGDATRSLLDAIQWLRIDLDAGNATIVKITLAGSESAVMSRVDRVKAAKKTSALPPVQAALTKYLLEQVFSSAPAINGNQLSWQVSIDKAMTAGLSDILSAALLQSDQLSANSHLRDLALALHNHHSAMKRFPSPLVGLTGKARQLSWRVDLLPFLNEEELYKEFRLEEPWDSEHNKRLIPRMPSVFRCPQSKHAPSSGLSTFVLPSHADSMWPADRLLDFKDILDGSSNTIMIVEAKDEFQQIWTKPDPFLIDLKNPTDQLGGHFVDRIYFARGDGSTGFMPKSKSDLMPAMLTRAGGEPVGF